MMKIKLGELPFEFTNRKQDNEFTLFETENGDVQLRIKTDLLSKNQGIITKEFSESSISGLIDTLKRIK